LIRACEIGDASLIKPLLDAGANIDDRDALGRTPLMISANNGEIAAVQELIARGALLSLTDTTPEALPLSVYAIKGGNPQVLSAILTAGGTSAANAADSKKQTVLMYAAEKGNEELIKILLAAGADADKKTANGKSVKDFASGKIRQNYFSETNSKSTIITSPRNASNDPKEEKLKETKLRMIDEPKVEWILGRSPKLRSMQVTVRNVGEEKAVGVKVEGILPGGDKIPLSGPEDIASNAVVTYQPLLGSPLAVSNTGKIDIRITCENCRK